MPIYRFGNKATFLYNNGSQIIKAYRYGNLCYQLQPSTPGVVTTNNENIIIYTTRYVKKTKETTRKKTDGTEEKTTETTKKELGREITLPSVSKEYGEAQIDPTTTSGTTWIGYAPRLGIKEYALTDYARLRYIRKDGGGVQSALFPTGNNPATWQGCGGGNQGGWNEGWHLVSSVGGSDSTTYTTPGDYEFNVSGSFGVPAGRSGTATVLRVGGNEGTYAACTCTKTPIASGGYTCSFSGSIPASYISSGTAIQVYIVGGGSGGYWGCSASAKFLGQWTWVESYFNDPMVLCVEELETETITEQEEGDPIVEIENEIQLSLTPASEYDPLFQTGVATMTVSEDGIISNLVELA